MKRKFYQITTNERTADIDIYGNITSDPYDWWTGEKTGVSAKSFREELEGLDVDTINVYINSYGGEVAEALAIYSQLKRHPATVNTYCDGFACSAATIIFAAGDNRTVGSIALLMIHNCMSYVGYANSEELRKAAEDNDKINQSSINAYMQITNLSEDEIKNLMDNETWLTAQECLEYGFATEIAELESNGTTQQGAYDLIRQAVLSDKKVEPDGETKKLRQLIEEKVLPALEKLENRPTIEEGNGDPEHLDAPEQTERENKAVAFFKALS